MKPTSCIFTLEYECPKCGWRNQLMVKETRLGLTICACGEELEIDPIHEVIPQYKFKQPEHKFEVAETKNPMSISGKIYLCEKIEIEEAKSALKKLGYQTDEIKIMVHRALMDGAASGQEILTTCLSRAKQRNV